MKFIITRDLQGKSRPGMPMSVDVTVQRRSGYQGQCDCEYVLAIDPACIAALVEARMVLQPPTDGKPVCVCQCMGHVDLASLVPPEPGSLKLSRPLICLDTETTGTDPETGRIIELGIVRLNPDGTRVYWEQRFNPECPIPAEATAVHGITDADVADKPTFASMAAAIHRGLAGRDLAGYSLRLLDLPILDAEFRRVGLKLDLTDVAVIDAFGIFSNREKRDLSAAVSKYCGREHKDAHGAASDAEETLNVLLSQLTFYPDLAEMDLQSLAAASLRDPGKRPVDLAGKLYRDAEGYIRYGFGKARDMRVADDPGFGHWMLRQNSPPFPGSTCEALKAEIERLGL